MLLSSVALIEGILYAMQGDTVWNSPELSHDDSHVDQKGDDSISRKESEVVSCATISTLENLMLSFIEIIFDGIQKLFEFENSHRNSWFHVKDCDANLFVIPPFTFFLCYSSHLLFSEFREWGRVDAEKYQIKINVQTMRFEPIARSSCALQPV